MINPLTSGKELPILLLKLCILFCFSFSFLIPVSHFRALVSSRFSPQSVPLTDGACGLKHLASLLLNEDVLFR